MRHLLLVSPFGPQLRSPEEGDFQVETVNLKKGGSKPALILFVCGLFAIPFPRAPLVSNEWTQVPVLNPFLVWSRPPASLLFS